MKVWYKCPVCGQKIAQIDDSKSIEGVYVWCKKHKGEVEIINIVKSQNQSQSRSIKIDLVSQCQSQSQLVDTG